jgi:plexin A
MPPPDFNDHTTTTMSRRGGGGAGATGARHHTASSHHEYHYTTNTLPRSIPEIYLTRLLTSKGTVQKFVDDLFASILRVNTSSFPLVIKHLFDTLDAEAVRYQSLLPPTENGGVSTAAAVAHSWKNNALPLRYWVNLIKNPDFVFDIDKSSTVDSCLSTVAQTFMDACSVCEQRLSHESPSNKLLFAKDLPRYRRAVAQFYVNVKVMPVVSAPDLADYMARVSKVTCPAERTFTCVHADIRTRVQRVIERTRTVGVCHQVRGGYHDIVVAVRNRRRRWQ